MVKLNLALSAAALGYADAFTMDMKARKFMKAVDKMQKTDCIVDGSWLLFMTYITNGLPIITCSYHRICAKFSS